MNPEEIKKRIDTIAPEVFKLQDARRADNLNEKDRTRLDELEKEYYELMGRLAEHTIEMLKK